MRPYPFWFLNDTKMSMKQYRRFGPACLFVCKAHKGCPACFPDQNQYSFVKDPRLSFWYQNTTPGHGPSIKKR
ncbi:hypothetical protein CHK_1488 [Christensenella hongkongensis]|uniref:Uncharacterized protein n=1 Tax=Christensenella hongkongensis TaxID=270498 RepID=A0A0M2NJF8_9FIRM|nr:hypothetical protein CHK_1488 [Christensenella hongkongensis]